jgi:hypothetical protein
MSKPSGSYSIDVGVAVKEIVPANNQRTAVTIFPVFGFIAVSGNPHMDFNHGIRLNPNNLPYTFCCCHHGDFVTRPIYAITGGGVITAFIIESFEPLLEQMLQAQILGGRYG